MIFFQLISKINEIDSKEKNDIISIDEKLSNLEHLISSMEPNQENVNEDEKIYSNKNK